MTKTKVTAFLLLALSATDWRGGADPCDGSFACPFDEHISPGPSTIVTASGPKDSGECECKTTDDGKVCAVKRACSFDRWYSFAIPTASHYKDAFGECKPIPSVGLIFNHQKSGCNKLENTIHELYSDADCDTKIGQIQVVTQCLITQCFTRSCPTSGT